MNANFSNSCNKNGVVMGKMEVMIMRVSYHKLFILYNAKEVYISMQSCSTSALNFHTLLCTFRIKRQILKNNEKKKRKNLPHNVRTTENVIIINTL